MMNASVAIQNEPLQSVHTVLRALGLSLSLTHFVPFFPIIPSLGLPLSLQMNLLILVLSPSILLSLREAAVVNLVGHN